ncbi:MAG: polysaccharide deacetylase family protein [Solirubrobacterales bacterium]
MNGTLALTYDDGPDPRWTEPLLALLRESGARATFFTLAPSAAANPALIERILGEGHEVGFHCCRHVRHSELSAREIADDLAAGLSLLRSVGAEPRAWRAPWGVETEDTRRLAAANELRLWRWTRDSHDWRGEAAGEMRARIERQGGLGDGDVVLMHDGLGPGAERDGCEETLLLSGALIAEARQLGLALVPVGELAGAAA